MNEWMDEWMNFSSYGGSSQVCSNTEVMKEKKGKKEWQIQIDYI